jgi:cytochrome c55X
MPAIFSRALAGAAAVALAGAVTASDVDVADAPSPARQRELVAFLRHDCGSCHGMRLTGGLGPQLTPDALRVKPTESLVATIIAGRAGTPMPPWRPFLSDTEAQWLVTRLLDGIADDADR